ncbi:MAG: hypothetical protein C5B50_22565 [Verrucomicrobia bacterium]|nr:MAG: hypothetical protein C5B50_22565 [Verrucomicrobiota bacterium]
MKLFLVFLWNLAALSVPAQTEQLLHSYGSISLSDISGRLDHLVADAAGRRLFVAALGNNSVEVLDLAAQKHVASFIDIQAPQGLLYLPKPDMLFVASGGDGQVRIYDCTSHRAVKTIGPLPNADNLRYDSYSGRVFVGYGDGALAMVNAISGVHTVSIPMGSHPESFQLEEHGNRIFVNLPQGGGVAVVDRLARTVAQTWPLPGVSGNYPMALDEGASRLFVGCRKPPRLEVLDTKSGKVLSETEISGDTDDLFLDGKRKRIYVSCGEGSLDVLEQRDGDHWPRVAKVRTAPGARTSLFISELDLLCVAVPKSPKQGCEVRIFQARPKAAEAK